MRVILVAGTTKTATIEGISAAGATSRLLMHTPSADAEIISYGLPIQAPVTPISPSGCPTPAVITRAIRERIGFDLTIIDAGLARPTGAPTVSVGARPGRDIRESEPVPTAPELFINAREFGQSLPDDQIVIGETIPGGTTTALAVCRALGVDVPTSSSIPTNPLRLKQNVTDKALSTAGISPGQFAHNPKHAIRAVGDPVLAVAAGTTVGAIESNTDVILGGGTQLLTVAALVRHAGVSERATLATTSYLAADVTGLNETATALNLDLIVTNPEFGAHDVDAGPLSEYANGVAKEGAGMGGALALIAEADRLNEVIPAVQHVLNRIEQQQSHENTVTYTDTKSP
jgi:uncharacterized protein (TIGR00303 family)